MKKLLHLKTMAALLACLVAMQANAYDFVKDGIYYKISGTNATVTYDDVNNTLYSGTVNIPATVTNGGTTYNVTSIGPSAFQGCTGLMRVVIPNSVNYIMNNAFKGCTGLRTITIPASVYTIYNNVFDGCTSLRAVICLSTSPGNWYANNFSSEAYTYATLYVPSGRIEAYQSSTYCWGNFNNFEEIECDFVQDAIFYKDLGNNQAAVSNVAFCKECYSGEMVIPQTVTNGANTYTVTSVDFGAFYDAYYMTSVVLPNSINEIDNYAFYDCIRLTQVNIPEGVTDINYCTFADCQALPSIVIPSTVTWIAQNAFGSCPSLTSITCRATTPPMCVDSSCFPAEAYTNATLTVPQTALNDYKAADVWKNFSNISSRDYDFESNGIYYIITGPNTASVTFKDRNYNSYSGTVNVPSTVTHGGTTYTVTAVGQAAFYRSSELYSVTLPNTVTALDYASFANCTSLSSVNIPSGVTSFGEFCFQSCAALTSINIPSDVTSIPRQCFLGCSSLSQVTIPGTVKEIGHFAFYNCSSMSSLSIQDGVETIRNNAFEACSSLQAVVIPASVSTINGNVFSFCTSMAAIMVDNENRHYRSQYGVLFNADMDTLISFPNMSTTNYSVPASVKVIGYNSFISCTNLNLVLLPEGVTTIETAAFAYCDNLISFQIPSSVSQIGPSALSSCLALTSIDVTAGNQNYMTDDGVLYTIDGKRLIQYPCARPDKHYSILNTADSISYEAFSESAYLKSVYVPSGIKTLYEYTFNNSNVERVVIDEGLETIGTNAFAGCSQLKSVYLPSTLRQIDDLAFQVDTEVEEITFAGTTPPTIGNNAFHGVGYYIDDPVTIYVPAGASSSYNSVDWKSSYFITNVTEISPLGSGVEFTVDSLNYKTTDTGLNAMVSGATTSIYDLGLAPKVSYQGNLCTVTKIGNNSCYSCTKVTKIRVPFTVTTIDNYAFYGCSRVKKLILNEGLKTIGSFSLSHINQLRSVDIPASVDSINGSTFNYDPALRYINVPDNNDKYTSVDGVLFSKDKKVLVSFPDNYGTSYNAPYGVQTIGVSALRGASALEQVALPPSLRQISSYAFFDGAALTSVVVPEGVTLVEYNAFNSCTSMSEVELPSTLTELGYNAFYNVPDLSSLTVKATTPPTCQIYVNPRTGARSEPFMDTHYTNVTLYVPRGCKSAYQNAAIWTKFTNIVEVDFPVEFMLGDVNGDGLVNVTDVTLLISRVVNESGNIIEEAGDMNGDGIINVTDVTLLISYVVNGTAPEPSGIDMWYLWGNFFGSDIWGWGQTGYDALGVSVLPMYPTGTFTNQGKGILTWTGYVPRQYFTIIHTPGDNPIEEMWVVNLNTGNYCVRDMNDDDPNYSSFLLDAGYYTITLNTRTMVLNIEPYLSTVLTFDAITMPGNHNWWMNDTETMTAATPRLLPENHDWWVADFTVTGGNVNELKFCTFGDWNNNWGSTDFPYGTGVQNGSNIPVQSGTYKVFFNDITGNYNFIKK